MKIKVSKLAEHVDTLCNNYNGELFDFEEQEDGTYYICTEYYLHAILNPDDELEWLDNGTIVIEGVTFRTCLLNHIKPGDLDHV